MKTKPIPLPKQQAGVGLLEVLVAVLILSLGLLGMAGLQTRVLQQNQSSLVRSQAVMLSYSVLDALRLDRDGAIAGTYNIPLTCAPPAPNGTLSGDTLSRWILDLRTRLGNTANTCGTIACANNGICTVRIVWDDTRAGGNANEEYVIRTRL
jgi:type IV pilus assembly protein PilV